MILIVVFIVLLNDGLGLTNTEEQIAIKFLKQYGYLPKDNYVQDTIQTNINHVAVLQFQNMAGLNMTGKIGMRELNLMKSSRCGVKDMDFDNSEPAMFSVSPRKWNLSELSYNIDMYPKGIPTIDVDRIIQSAFDIWSKYTGLRFTLKRSSKTDFKISWTSKEHNDEDFDGPGNVLAHAFFPPSGWIHFDNEENWSTMPGKGKINIYHVAAHEIGHALGLGHSDNRGALMYPYINYNVEFENNLHQDDIDGIKFIYEPRNSTLEINNDLTGSPLCTKGPINSMVNWQGGVYIFKNKYYIKLSNDLSTVTVGNISNMWNGITDQVKVVNNEKKLYVFRYKQYWRFSGTELDEGYPRNIIEGFPGIPNYINSVIYFRGKFIFFKGQLYWVYDPRKIPVVSPIYPKNIAGVLKNFPFHVDAMHYDKNGQTIYGFKGEFVYLYDVRHNSTGAPISIAKDFFGC